MPGRRRCRRVDFQPNFVYFEPRGLHSPGEKTLKVEELESIRLKDYLQLNQEEAAKRMGVSQPTFHRMLSEAHRKIAEALVDGNAIRIEGGDYIIGMAKTPLPPLPPMGVPPGWRKGRGEGLSP